MKHLLITGATGLLGEYLLRDLTRLDRPLAVVARGSSRRSAEQRIETMFSRLERTERRPLRRPVVLTGDLRKSRLGLSTEAEKWVAESCDTMLHNAASLQFIEDPKTGEPYRSNVDGTRHMLELVEATGLRKLHHVSTAYVCGQRRGLVGESDKLDLATAGNDYERSKIESERLVRGFNGLDSLVVYRPAIIVGDHRTGYTSTYHGFYVPLQLCHSICMASPTNQGLPHGVLLQALGLTGEERKNFVPVDWVSRVIVDGVTDNSGRFDGQTLHLTPGERVSVANMTGAIIEALAEMPRTARRSKTPSRQDPGQLLSFFQEQMKVYEAYWRDDPEFDSETTTKLVPEAPCPAVDAETMKRLCSYAIRTNFGARREISTELASWLGDPGLPIGFTPPVNLSPSERPQVVSLCVTGPGGGDCWFSAETAGDTPFCRGTTADPALELRMNRTTLDALMVGDLSPLAAVRRGQVAAFGRDNRPPTDESVHQATERFLGMLRKAAWQSATAADATSGTKPGSATSGQPKSVPSSAESVDSRHQTKNAETLV